MYRKERFLRSKKPDKTIVKANLNEPGLSGKQKVLLATFIIIILLALAAISVYYFGK